MLKHVNISRNCNTMRKTFFSCKHKFHETLFETVIVRRTWLFYLNENGKQLKYGKIIWNDSKIDRRSSDNVKRWFRWFEYIKYHGTYQSEAHLGMLNEKRCWVKLYFQDISKQKSLYPTKHLKQKLNQVIWT